MERRMYERVSLPIKLKYEVKSRPQLIKESISRNISGAGICLSLTEKLLPKTQLTIQIEIGGRGDIVHLNGIVIWVRRVEVQGGSGPVVYYDTGIELIDADPVNINRVITGFYGKAF